MEFYGVAVGIGNIIAACLSWKRNESFLFAILHFWIGWPYVLWWLITK